MMAKVAKQNGWKSNFLLRKIGERPIVEKKLIRPRLQHYILIRTNLIIQYAQKMFFYRTQNPKFR